MLRFKRDDGSDYPDWEEKKFGTFITTITEKTSDKDKYPLYSLTIEDGVVPKSERYGREHLVLKTDDIYKIVPPNAFVYNPMNLRFGAVKVNHEDISVAVSGYYDVFMMGTVETLAFWENYLVCHNMINWYNAIATGSLVEKKRVHFSQFIDIKKNLPCLEEQQKIASFFADLDEVISKSEAEVAVLEKQKKGVMQKIFSQEVRFKKDDGSEYPNWEEKKFRDICFRVAERNNGQFDKTKWISVAKMYYQDANKVMSNNIDTRTYVMRKGDMAFEGHSNNEFAFGRFVVNDIGDGVISELFPIYRFKGNYVLKYWKYAIQVETIMFHVYRKAILSGGASSNKLDESDFLSCSISVPCLEEQQKIADFLSDFDAAISLAKKELEQWKLLKKGLLQQMFV